VLGGGGFFYGLAGFEFSYDEVKRAVVIGLIGFFLFIASAAISKNIILRPISPHSPCAPDVPGAYNINSSSGCVRPG